MAKSKYAGLVGKLPSLPGVAPERRDVVEVLKAEIKAPLSEKEAALPEGSARADVASMLTGIEQRVSLIMALAKRVHGGKLTTAEFGRAYAELRAMRETFSRYDSMIGLLVETYQWLWVEAMTAEGLINSEGKGKMVLANGAPISVWKEPYAKVEDPEKFLAWVEADADLRKKLTLPWQTTNKLTKDRLVAGEAEPDGVTCYAMTKVRLGGEEE